MYYAKYWFHILSSNKILIIFILIFTTINIICTSKVGNTAPNEIVVLIIDPELSDGINNNLDQFEADLNKDGYTVIKKISDFENPSELRNYLIGLYSLNQNLTGAILIGDIPHAYQHIVTVYTNPNLLPTDQEIISFQYYADLDGVFEASSGYVSHGGHEYSYDIHSGQVDWEIWIGVLPIYKGNVNYTIDALNRYFVKNHQYRINKHNIPRAYLEINELNSVSTIEEYEEIIQLYTSGIYAWTPFSNATNAYFYFNSPPTGISVMQGYVALSDGVADFTVGAAHGSSTKHGQINTSWIENNTVRTIFFISGACLVGNLDSTSNFLTSVLYSSTSTVLLAQGSTGESVGLGTNEQGFYGHNIATSLTQRSDYGDAILNHVNVPLIYPWSIHREPHFTNIVILGDPTLKLKQKRVKSMPWLELLLEDD